MFWSHFVKLLNSLHIFCAKFLHSKHTSAHLIDLLPKQADSSPATVKQVEINIPTETSWETLQSKLQILHCKSCNCPIYIFETKQKDTPIDSA